MTAQTEIDYHRIAKAISFLKANYKRQPSLDEVAEAVSVSPFHFQRMFKEWAGVTPKQFLQYLSLEHAKNVLIQQQATLAEAAFETGLSGTGRLHDLFVTIEGMTPGEYKNGGEQLQINYSFQPSLFGELFIASTHKGICHISFADGDPQAELNKLQLKFPNASFSELMDEAQQNVMYLFNRDWAQLQQVKLHLKGTPFQLKVWEALLKIPTGNLTTYARLANTIENPLAHRAVGTAVGQNPVAYLIPCHRVIRSTGETGDYHWGSDRKSAILGWEAARFSPKAIVL
ncbi:methylated-DNA--[protein]-cysteine S-methyltransferase [Mucilaginibacter sp. RS28]|uniref:methylated-DNA--[protein]-cysteine S-methyltransferase n=1 Tax=Mucilaginibacter straminoryzae TaxID=2932774 RepID=A0A9X2B7T5_9SPHI|nr:methylated-DNA--[protein]-cysteine S-methyltransferase [Mucilaginibacter straminoryzae]MCJ8208711.1 methylated-DNA--[protein]-cysteine S-methyltransferase [Mucilaginibacter straminoryzae]